MGRNNLEKQRRRQRRKQKSKQRRRQRKIGPHPQITPTAYQVLFARLAVEYEDQIADALHKSPLRFRQSWFSSRGDASTFDRQKGWQELRDYLDAIENRMAEILRNHSLAFWLHLYRRIGVMLSPNHHNKTDANTVGLVRATVESAILKYSPMTSDDMMVSGADSNRKPYGGMAGQGVLESHTFVPADFSGDDYVNMHAVEGLAYEYWYTTALMRSTGRGSRYLRPGVEILAGQERDLSVLIRSYDDRIQRSGFDSTMLGMTFTNDPVNLAIVFFYYNVHKTLLDASDLELRIDGPTNFLPATIDPRSFVRSHEFMLPQFRRRNRFSLQVLCAALMAGSVSGMMGLRGLGRSLMFLQLLQRGYSIEDEDRLRVTLRTATQQILSEWRMFGTSNDEIDLAIDHLTMDTNKQSLSSLWTHGPRYMFLPIGGNRVLVDLTSVPFVLRTSFFRLRDNQGEKGPMFEEVFRGELSSVGADLLPQRRLVTDRAEREVDAAVRCNSTLLLFECRAMERPLDFELGRPETIDRRDNDFRGKLLQADTLREFVLAHPRGTNYDFSWAKTVLSFVVSPFVEWIWSRGSDCWYGQVPRLLSVSEAIDLAFSVAQNGWRDDVWPTPRRALARGPAAP